MRGTNLTARELSPRYPVLGLLYFQPMHGYDLHRKLETNLHEIWHISQSQVYALLKRLEAEGLLQANREAQEKRPDRSTLYLTESGKNAFITWLNTPTLPSSRAIRMEFLTRIYFASQLGEKEALRVIKEQKEATQKDLEKIQERYKLLPHDEVFSRMGLDLRIRQIISILDWLESCELKQSSPFRK